MKLLFSSFQKIFFLGLSFFLFLLHSNTGYSEPIAGEKEIIQKIKSIYKGPLYLPNEFGGEDTLYLCLEKVSPSGYSVVYGFDAPNPEGSGCPTGGTYLASFSAGQKMNTKNQGTSFSYKTVRGKFSPSECGASCADGVATWTWGSVSYLLGVKGVANKKLLYPTLDSILKRGSLN